MKVTIDRVTLIGSENFVHFTTDVGSAIGVWKGLSPNVGESHDVEIDVTERIVWSVSGDVALQNLYSIEVENGLVNLSGKIISMEADGGAALEVAGSVILLDIFGYTGDVPVFVDLKIERISLFPTGV